MKKTFALFIALMLSLSTMAYAGGDKNHSSKGQGSTGTDGSGSTTQQRGY